MNEPLKLPLTMEEVWKKYPELKGLALLTNPEPELAQQVCCEIVELVRQLDFKAHDGREI